MEKTASHNNSSRNILLLAVLLSTDTTQIKTITRHQLQQTAEKLATNRLQRITDVSVLYSSNLRIQLDETVKCGRRNPDYVF